MRCRAGVTPREDGDNRWAVVIVCIHECSGMCRAFLPAESECLQMLCFCEIRKRVLRKVRRINHAKDMTMAIHKTL